MILEVQNKYNLPLDLLKLKTILKAQRVVSLYKRTSSELLLDEFLKERYNINLKILCYTIISGIKLSVTYQNEIFIDFMNPQLEKLARVITYGTGKIPGSRILVDALTA